MHGRNPSPGQWHRSMLGYAEMEMAALSQATVPGDQEKENKLLIWYEGCVARCSLHHQCDMSLDCIQGFVVWLTVIYGFTAKYKHQELVNKNNKGKTSPQKLMRHQEYIPGNWSPREAPVLVSHPFFLQVKARAWPCLSVHAHGVKLSSHVRWGGQPCWMWALLSICYYGVYVIHVPCWDSLSD